MAKKSEEAQVEALAEIDGRYNKEAYAFVYKALHYTVQRLGKRQFPPEQRHISGKDLPFKAVTCKAVQYAIKSPCVVIQVLYKLC